MGEAASPSGLWAGAGAGPSSAVPCRPAPCHQPRYRRGRLVTLCIRVPVLPPAFPVTPQVSVCHLSQREAGGTAHAWTSRDPLLGSCEPRGPCSALRLHAGHPCIHSALPPPCPQVPGHSGQTEHHVWQSPRGSFWCWEPARGQPSKTCLAGRRAKVRRRPLEGLGRPLGWGAAVQGEAWRPPLWPDPRRAVCGGTEPDQAFISHL